MALCTWKRWNPGKLSVLSGMCSPSQVLVKQVNLEESTLGKQIMEFFFLPSHEVQSVFSIISMNHRTCETACLVSQVLWQQSVTAAGEQCKMSTFLWFDLKNGMQNRIG